MLLVPSDRSVIFLSTPSARRATQRRPAPEAFNDISIHALREEGDPQAEKYLARMGFISIHALREEGDICCGSPPA